MQDAKRRALLFLVVALLLSAIAGYMFLQKSMAVDAELGDFVPVYVAKENIDSRKPLNAEMFEQKAMPRQYVEGSIVTDLNSISLGQEQVASIGQLVSVVPLSKGEILTANVLKRETELRSGNHRMVMLFKSDRVGFDDNFNQRDLVDIIVTDKNMKTSIYMKNVEVVALGIDANKNVTGLGLEMTLEEAANFIGIQNTAASIRVLKAPNTGNGKVGEKEGAKKQVKQPNQNSTTNTQGNPMETDTPQQ
ncbi:flp pilus assembly protein CpaB [Laceyella sacchari]|jgi:hypothetical protein|uniref:Flp pilus assembly protein CpaB n=1 Tax=Laceyella sacchari TaxID=37482 RepID=A0ABY5U5E3_LACSH|nr:flp pilus assembly protein CpaB [Laceyella sacchari]UWE03795.1 flp pilus assembly protein CpaB [Laceyella sacchari]